VKIELNLNQDQFFYFFTSIVIQRAIKNTSPQIKEVGQMIWRDYRHLLSTDEQEIFKRSFLAFQENSDQIQKSFEDILNDFDL